MRAVDRLYRTAVCGCLLLALGCTDLSAPDGADASDMPSLEPAAILVQPASVTMQAGQSRQLQAQVNDASGQPIAGARLSYSLAGGCCVTVSATGLVSATGPVGEASVRVASGRRANTVPVVVSAGRAQRLVWPDGNAVRMPAGAPPRNFTARVLDWAGNGVPATSVAFELDSRPLSLVASGPDGSTAVEIAKLETVGRHTLSAAVPDLPAIAMQSVEIQVDAGPPAAMSVVGAVPMDVEAGANISGPLVMVRDGFGNPVAQAVLQLEIPAAVGSLQRTEIVTGEDGMARLAWIAGRAGARGALKVTLAGDNGGAVAPLLVHLQVARAAKKR
ncbi:MAG: hypothetical protein R3E77_10720 [Steroidobacteraceae bacterium]